MAGAFSFLRSFLATKIVVAGSVLLFGVPILHAQLAVTTQQSIKTNVAPDHKFVVPYAGSSVIWEEKYGDDEAWVSIGLKALTCEEILCYSVNVALPCNRGDWPPGIHERTVIRCSQGKQE